MARVEVLAPDGTLVAVSKEVYAVGLPGVNGASITFEPPEMKPKLPAGEYTVVYRVLGAFAFDVTVDVSYTG